MNYDVIAIRYLEGYKLEIDFENGKRGIVDFHGYIKKGAFLIGFLIWNILSRFK